MKSINNTNYVNNQKAIKGVLTKELNIISTFNGIGAFSDALKQLGITSNKVICEIDEAANRTYYANNKYVRRKHINDIRKLLRKIKKGLKIDILVSTPPCQSFSIQGLREGFKSENGNLFLTAINLQKKVDANIVIYENVKGLVSHDKFTGQYSSLINQEYKSMIGHTLHTIETLLLEDDRYNYYWKVLNSNQQGLPQNRERIFIVGIKKELDKGFKFPENIDLKYTVEDVLEHKVANNFFYKNNAGHELIPTYQERRVGKIHTIAKYSETMTYESTRRVYAPYVSPCITTNNNAKFKIDGKIRTLTPEEAKRVHGFSDDYKLVGSTTNQNKQLGNTVSPGVYVRLLTSIFEAVKTIPANNITIKKSIVNNSDMNYLNITSKKYEQYMKFIDNGGKLFLEIEKYESMYDKNNKINSRLIKVEITDLLPKGYRNKKQSVRRYRIISPVQNIAKKPANNIDYTRVDAVNTRNRVLYPWVGSKRAFTDKIQEAISVMNMEKSKFYIDSFGGSMNFTINNIEKVKAKYYVINDLDPILASTYKAIKRNYKKVQKYYMDIRAQFLESIPKEFRNMRSITKRYRDKCIDAKMFYKTTVSMLNSETDIYKIAAIFIWKMQYATNGMLNYRKGQVSNTNFSWKFNVQHKLKEIAYYSSILNRYDVIIENLDVFELVKKYSHSNAFIYLDPPYLNTVLKYNSDNSNEFQLKLLKATNKYRYRLYSNEDCKKLYELGIDRYFHHEYRINRKNNLGKTRPNSGGKEYLAFSINNTDYAPRVVS